MYLPLKNWRINTIPALRQALVLQAISARRYGLMRRQSRPLRRFATKHPSCHPCQWERLSWCVPSTPSTTVDRLTWQGSEGCMWRLFWNFRREVTVAQKWLQSATSAQPLCDAMKAFVSPWGWVCAILVLFFCDLVASCRVYEGPLLLWKCSFWHGLYPDQKQILSISFAVKIHHAAPLFWRMSHL